MTIKRFGSACSLWVLLCVLGVILVACAGNSSPSTFYILRSMESPQENLPITAGERNVSVLVGPIALPGYLDRNQLVTVAGKNEMALDEFNRWAESLRDGFYRVLMEDLSLLLKTPEVYGYDRSEQNSADYQVSIDVTRFDCALEDDAVLTVFWTVFGMGDGAPNMKRKSVFRAPVSGSSFSAIVEAQNQTLTAFGREIAAAIQSAQHEMLER